MEEIEAAVFSAAEETDVLHDRRWRVTRSLYLSPSSR